MLSIIFDSFDFTAKRQELKHKLKVDVCTILLKCFFIAKMYACMQQAFQQIFDHADHLEAYRNDIVSFTGLNIPFKACNIYINSIQIEKLASQLIFE